MNNMSEKDVALDLEGYQYRQTTERAADTPFVHEKLRVEYPTASPVVRQVRVRTPHHSVAFPFTLKY